MKALKSHEVRMINELEELKDRTGKLKLFIDSGNPRFISLDVEDQRLLKSQLSYMSGYEDMLRTRVSRFLTRLGKEQ